MDRRNQIAFPEFKCPAPHRSLKSDRAENKTPVRLEIIVFKELLATLQREIGAVNKVLMKLVPVGVDVLDAFKILTIDNKQDVRQRIWRVGVVNHS